MKFLLLIPPSNAYCESIFRTVKKICTDDRHNLGKDTTRGHANTSVYQLNIFLKQGIKCYEWTPAENVIKSATFATYKNLILRKDNEDGK